MKKNDQQRQREQVKKQQTPIIDGDARPDIDLNPEETAKDETLGSQDREKTTQNRKDTNSLEDFRDAK